jgi:hypothetical protein
MTIAQRLVFVFEWKGVVHSKRRGCRLTQPLEGKAVVYGKLWPASPFPIAGLPTPFPCLPLVPPSLRNYVSSRSEWAILGLSRGKEAGAWCCPSNSIQCRGQRKSGAIRLHLWAFVPCSRVNFTFTFTVFIHWKSTLNIHELCTVVKMSNYCILVLVLRFYVHYT